MGIEVKTSGEIDYNFPEAGVKAITTTASKTMLFKDIEASDTSTLPNDAVEISIDNSTRYQTMEGFGPAITGSSAYNLSKMKPAEREKILKAANIATDTSADTGIRTRIGTRSI